MLTLINTNRMVPPIAPIGLDYIATSVRRAGIDVDVVDLCLADEPDTALRDYFASHSPELVGVSFRNADDSFWPSAEWFVPALAETIRKIRALTDAPLVVGGVGFSIFAQHIIEYTGADFGIRGDGEKAIVSLFNELQQGRHFEHVDGLIWRQDSLIRSNKPAWPSPLSLPTNRDAIDNFAYFQRGGQSGLETKRGCNRRCLYCADHLAKGVTLRLRDPSEVADEVESLISQGVEVLHLCDSEFNIPREHAYAVCEEFVRRSLAERVRWYAYMAVVPFDAELAEIMSRAGCVGIDFTGDSACASMLKAYHQPHSREDLASAVCLCREHGIKVMIDLLLGGPGETPETVAQTIDFIKHIEPDCAGAALGVRIYPGTAMADVVASEGPAETNPNIHRRYDGPVDFFRPTFYISQALGPRPGKLVRDLIAGDKRFFEPMEEISPETATTGQSTDHNYNDNTELVEAIKKGARGAYWDILHESRLFGANRARFHPDRQVH
jgi:radical SAM superfamily enzyme YgiQ (UPF0313 family)